MTSRTYTHGVFQSACWVTTIFFLLTISYLATFVRSDDEPDARIVGGKDANFNEYPWFTTWGTSCGATLIHEDILLTAAHVS